MKEEYFDVENAYAGLQGLPHLLDWKVAKCASKLEDLSGHYSPTETEESLRKYWLENYHYKLPERIPYYLLLKQGPLSPPVLFPSCCVWTGGELSFNQLAAKKHSSTITKNFLDALKDFPLLAINSAAPPSFISCEFQSAKAFTTGSKLLNISNELPKSTTGKNASTSAEATPAVSRLTPTAPSEPQKKILPPLAERVSLSKSLKRSAPIPTKEPPKKIAKPDIDSKIAKPKKVAPKKLLPKV